MRCDVVAVGTELLLGQIVDTNSSWIGEQLAASGIDSLLQVKVGDNLGRIVAVLRRTLADADAVIMCGGLGPTHDDLTREAIAAVMGVELHTDDQLVEVITAMFAARGRYMAANNLRQALVPDGATIIPQTRGTAPGLICPVTIDGVAKVVYAVPGVPHEMRDMIERAVLPDLLERGGEPSVIVSRVLRTWGESESGLNERLDGLIERARRGRQPDAGVPRQRLGGPQGAAHGQGRHRRGGAVRCSTRGTPRCARSSASTSSASTTTRWSRWCSTCSRPVAGRSAWPSRSPAAWWPGGSPPCRVPARCSAARSSATPARSSSTCSTCPRGRWSARPRPQRWPPAPSGCSAPTWRWRSPASPGRPSRTACRSARCASASRRPSGAFTRTLRLPGQRDQMRQMSVISALDLLRRHLLDAS